MNSLVYNIEDIFTPHNEFKNIYKQKITQGLDYAKDNKLLILSIVRNIQDKYKYSLKQIKNLLKYFHPESAVCIYENDSIDNSPDLIKKHISDYDEYNRFYLFSEELGTPNLPLSKSTIRTTNLANARNKCWDLGQRLLPDANFVLVIDLDFLDMSINGILNSFGWFYSNPSISAICGNSYIDMSSKAKSSFHNYDSFAFRINHWSYHEFLWFPYFNLPIGSVPIAVNSGFGGACIYRKNFYDGLYGGQDCEHVILHKKLTEKYTNFSLYYNPSQIMLLD